MVVDETSGTQISYHRPFLRSALARSLYDRMMREEQLRKFDKNKWYKVDMEQIDPEMKDRFIEFNSDEETDRFIETCYSKSDWFITHVFHSMVRSILTLFMTSTSINGFLDRGSMFVFSTEQFSKLYDQLPSIKAAKESSSLLDLGAGDGKVTQVMAQFFGTIHVTEVSPVMKRTLGKKGYTVLDIDKWADNNGTYYDLISCLNLLDRCDKPVTILQEMVTKLKPNGRILIAIVLPLSQYVESNSTGSESGDHRPSEVLNVEGETFEQQVGTFNSNVLAPNGLEVVKWTRLPYLCEGDLDLSFYWLHDVVFLVKRIADE